MREIGVQLRLMGDDAEAVSLARTMLETALGGTFRVTGQARTRRGSGLAVFGRILIDATDEPPTDPA
jgi:hypothetical protein